MPTTIAVNALCIYTINAVLWCLNVDFTGRDANIFIISPDLIFYTFYFHP